MAALDAEVRAVQNSAFGAAILAGFVHGYFEGDSSKKGAPLPYLYLVLPMILHADIYRLVRGTRPSLRHLAEKFVSTEAAGTDLLLSLQKRALDMRRLTSECVAVLLIAGLAHLDPKQGRLVPRKVDLLSDRPEVPEQAAEARKLGHWFSELSPFEIGNILKVTF